jgi:transcriptional regulator with XRE-family HTH domain
MQVKKLIRAYRLKRGLKQTELGKLFSVSESTVQRWEYGEATPPLRVLDTVLSEFITNKMLDAPRDGV